MGFSWAVINHSFWQLDKKALSKLENSFRQRVIVDDLKASKPIAKSLEDDDLKYGVCG